MTDTAEPFFAKEKEAEEGGLEEKREKSFHREGLANDAAGGSGEFGPVGAELKFHGDTGDDADGEVNAENFGPEASRAIVVLVAGAKRDGFENDDEQGEAHGQLREQVMESNGKGEMQTMDI